MFYAFGDVRVVQRAGGSGVCALYCGSGDVKTYQAVRPASCTMEEKKTNMTTTASTTLPSPPGCGGGVDGGGKSVLRPSASASLGCRITVWIAVFLAVCVVSFLMAVIVWTMASYHDTVLSLQLRVERLEAESRRLTSTMDSIVEAKVNYLLQKVGSEGTNMVACGLFVLFCFCLCNCLCDHF